MLTLFRWVYRIVVYGVLLPGFLFGFAIGVYSTLYPAGGRLDNPYPTVKTLDEAVRAVYIERQTIEGQREYCVGSPDEKARYAADAAPVIWWSHNSLEVATVDAYLATGNGAKIKADAAPTITAAIAKFRADSGADRDKACMAATQAIIDHWRDIATEGPAVAKLLGDYAAKDPASGQRVWREDALIGCMQEALKQKKMDYGTASKFCPCMVDVVEGDLSDSERKQLSVGARSESAKVVPETRFQQLAPKIVAQCRALMHPER